MPGLTVLGNVSKTVFLATEEDKITVELTANEAIKKGQPIKLTIDGKAAIWAAADGLIALIGYAYGDCAIGALTTIWSRGYAMIYALSGALQDAGPVVYSGYNTTTLISGNAGYSNYSANAVATASNGWALDNAGAAGVLIRVLLRD